MIQAGVTQLFSPFLCCLFTLVFNLSIFVVTDEFEPLDDNQEIAMEAVMGKRDELQDKVFCDAKANIEKIQKGQKKKYDNTTSRPVLFKLVRKFY